MDELHRELLSQGVRESSGAFTLALEAVLPVLARHQLPSPEACILRFLAAAVAAGATFFQYHRLGNGYAVEYDGLPVDLEELPRSILGGGEPRLTELAIGVNAAGGRGGKCTVNGALTVQDGAWTLDGLPTSSNRIEVTWPGLSGRMKRLLNREVRLLGERGRWSGLFQPKPIPARYTVRVGNPPVLLPADEHRHGPGCGYILLDTSFEQVCAVVHGVSFDWKKRLIPRVGVLWWDDELALDLSRQRPVEGELPAALTEVLLEVLVQHAQPDSPWAAWLAAQEGPVEKAFLFAMADGSVASLAMLHERYRREGYLGVSEVPFTRGSAWDASQVVRLSSALQAVAGLFPHALRVDHLARVREMPRLPIDQEYLARVPLVGAIGEMGLRAGEHEPYNRLGHGAGWVERNEPTTSFDAVMAEGSKRPLWNTLPELYRALVEQESGLPACYAIDALYQAAHHVVKRADLAALLADYRRWGSWTIEDLRAFARRVMLPLHGGGSLALSDLAGVHYCVDQDIQVEEPPPDALVLSQQARHRLEQLLNLDVQVVSWAGVTYFTEEAVRCFSSAAEKGLLQAFWREPESTAGWILRTMGDEPPVVTDFDLSQFHEKVALHAYRAARCPMGTDVMLLAHLAQPCEWLADRRRSILDAMPALRGVEALGHLDRRIAESPHLPVWYRRRAVFRALRGDLEGAEASARRALQLAPEDRHSPVVLAAVKAQQGDQAVALQIHPGFDSGPDLYRGEYLLDLGRPEEALAGVDETGHGLVLLGRIRLALGDPAAALEAARRALEDESRPASVHEVLGDALWETGDRAGAGAAYRAFCEEVRAYGLFEYGVARRVARAESRTL